MTACGSADWGHRTQPVFMWCRMLDIGAHHACWLLLQALFMTASVLTVTSTTATRTMNKGLFMLTSRPRPLADPIFVVQKWTQGEYLARPVRCVAAKTQRLFLLFRGFLRECLIVASGVPNASPTGKGDGGPNRERDRNCVPQRHGADWLLNLVDEALWLWDRNLFWCAYDGSSFPCQGRAAPRETDHPQIYK